MPKVVDHEARRKELAEAVWRLVEREGIDHVTVRAVAAESGWSSGSVRHYFPTQDSLLAFAMELAFMGFVDQARQLDQTGSYRDRVRDFVHLILPVDGRRRTAATVWMAFMPRSRLDPVLHSGERAGTMGLVDWCERLFTEAGQAGQLRPGADPRREAKLLIALVDGLTFHHLLGPDDLPVAELVGLVDDHLADLFPEH
ncbi:TetR/AcrR family transcriptional regulator [Goodfellowiella coeruleoviolacea]|uniref:Transcriptional regulator, TetR family n=1 Tax=Goodfellowiella coeruleoviolacea TaxID=334858 RepID=A0AAE3GBD0_9PSEU|nr:TetR/AcrR family transcriptional regulator [Goodfellowiella coeruleoviolacea]MCP2165176.1 transcriptional regulator, TetR family [Goodfellowiella coeruleoviolacea]